MNDVGQHSKAGELNIHLLTPIEVASLLRISKNGVYRMIEKRAIPFYRVRGVIRFDQGDVRAFLLKGRVEPVK